MGVTSGAAGRSRSGSQAGQIIALSVAGQVSGSVGLRGGVIGHREYSTSMSRPAGGRRLGRHRFGVCHRCGWKALVSRVGREEHLRIGTGRAFGRLCDDCFDTLLSARSVHGAAATATDGAFHRQLTGAGRPPR
jgi:hypothetical protein